MEVQISTTHKIDRGKTPYFNFKIDREYHYHHAEEFLTEFDLPENAIDRQANYLTLSGFTTHQLGKVSSTSHIFEWEDYQFEIVDMDGNRVDKIPIEAL